MNEEDYVFYKNGGTVMSGGFVINSKMLSGGKSPIENIAAGSMIGGDTTNQLAVPASLAYVGGKKTHKSSSTIKNEDEVISDDIHDKLLKMIEVSRNSLTQKGLIDKFELVCADILDENFIL